jgi:hypothetical protein
MRAAVIAATQQFAVALAIVATIVIVKALLIIT